MMTFFNNLKTTVSLSPWILLLFIDSHLELLSPVQISSYLPPNWAAKESLSIMVTGCKDLRISQWFRRFWRDQFLLLHVALKLIKSIAVIHQGGGRLASCLKPNL